MKSFVVEYKDKQGAWLPVRLNEETTTIGYKRLLRFETITSDALRIRFTDSRGPLCISSIGVYDAGQGADIAYTVPTEQLKSFSFTLPDLPEQDSALAADRNAQTTLFVEGDRLLIDLGAERTVSSSISCPTRQNPTGDCRHLRAVGGHGARPSESFGEER